MVLTQLISLYIFSRIILGKASLVPFLVASFVFIFYPYKYSLLIETHDGLLYSNMILYITLLLWSFKNLDKLSTKKILFSSLGVGLLLSFFLNANIAFLPIVIYTSIILAFIFRSKLLANSRKSFIYVFIMVGVTALINIPLLNSLFQNGNSRHYEGYISFNYIDSFLSGLSIAQTDIQITILLAMLLILCFIYAPIKRTYKLWMLSAYVFIAIMIAGNNSPINIYGWMFEHVPLIDSLRATYRFMFFELMIFFIIIYVTLRKLHDGNMVQLLLFGMMSALFIYLPLQHISTNKDYFFKTSLPEEYFDAQKYLNTKPEKKVYFPPRTPIFRSIATDYTWGKSDYKASILLYKNPFTSLLPVTNLVQFERYPYLLSPEYLEINYLTDLRLSPADIVRALELRQVKYIILDKNYKWNEIYPEFEIDTLMEQGVAEKQFGNITILRLKGKSNKCKKGYGTILLEYCTSYDKDTKLINKTFQEFTLETSPEKIGKKLSVRRNSIYTKSVLDPILHRAFVDNRVLFSKEIMQVSGNQKEVFSTDKLKAGKYRLYIALFKYSGDGKLMKDAKVVVYSAGEKVKEISPYTTRPKIYWESIDLELRDGQKVYVGIENEGYIIFSAIPIIKTL
ncbi:MAG: hypothetical protein H0W89_00225 [Candidatus Levybacteria bacterium]|nr:hypothetical protein [Candidatus Levybacteria bacterium]